MEGRKRLEEELRKSLEANRRAEEFVLQKLLENGYLEKEEGSFKVKKGRGLGKQTIIKRKKWRHKDCRNLSQIFIRHKNLLSNLPRNLRPKVIKYLMEYWGLKPRNDNDCREYANVFDSLTI